MKLLSINGRALAMLVVVVPLVALLAYVALRSGPLAPVAITVATVESRALTPALFGIGTVEARYTHKIGPTLAARIQRLDEQVGDVVQAGQLLGEMDAVDLNDRIRSAEAALKRSEVAIKGGRASGGGVISPDSVWMNTRFNQVSAAGLAAGLSANITLRSRSGQGLAGRVLRVEPLANAVTEETLAKLTFDQLPNPLPPLGELAEVTVALPAHPSAPVISNAALRQLNNQLGVWQMDQDQLRFTPVTLGVADLEGHVQVRSGLKVGDQIVVYSENTLSKRSRFHVVEHLMERATRRWQPAGAGFKKSGWRGSRETGAQRLQHVLDLRRAECEKQG